MSRTRYSLTHLAIVALILTLVVPHHAQAQTLFEAGVGPFNGYLGQTNISECDNGNSSPVNIRMTITDLAGTALAVLNYSVAASGSAHIIINDTVAAQGGTIVDKIGSVKHEVVGDQTLLNKLSCRMAFYRPAPAGGPKTFEYAYVIPIESAKAGQLVGMYNSIDPTLGGGSNPTQNWLSITNRDSTPFSASVQIRNQLGSLIDTVAVAGLAAGQRQDIPLGHPLGQVTGMYQIIPADLTHKYDAVLVRYGPSASGYNFAFPLVALSPSCSGEPLQASTMNNGATDNWLEVANVRQYQAPITIEVKDRFGVTLASESRTLAPFEQFNYYLSPVIDPPRTGNVGSVTVTCSDPTSAVNAAVAFYGHQPGGTVVDWSYSSQARGISPANVNAQLIAPVNTFVGMANWLKLGDAAGLGATVDFDLHDVAGTLVASGADGLPVGGTVDQDVHSLMGPNNIGAITLSTEDSSSLFNGQMLRILFRADTGDLGTLIPIPATVRQKGDAGSFVGNPQSLAKYRDSLTYDEARRLGTVMGFGVSNDDILAIQAAGLDATVDSYLDVQPDPTSVKNEANDWKDGVLDGLQGPTTHTGWQRYWLTYMYKSPNKLREKLSLILHDRLAASCAGLTENTNFMGTNYREMDRCGDYLALIRNNSLGSYKTLMHNMTKDYLMLEWLNGNDNFYKPGASQNENYARELNELFSTGANEKAGAGLQYPLYTDTEVTGDIPQLALGLTGYITGFDSTALAYKATLVPARHFTGDITLYKDTPFEITGSWDPEEVSDVIFQQRGLEVGMYLGKMLFTAFCHDHLDNNGATQLARIMMDNDFNIGATSEIILKSEACFSPDVNKSRVMDPWTFAIGFLRKTGIPMTTERLDNAIRTMGQQVLAPLDVFGYPALGSRDREHQESEYNNAFITQYYNFIITALTNQDNDFPGQYNFCDLAPFAGAGSVQTLDYLLDLTGAEAGSAEERYHMLRYLDNRLVNMGGGVFQEQVSPFTSNDTEMCRDRLAGLMEILALTPKGLTY